MRTALFIVLHLAAQTAHAMCAFPRPFLLPLEGSTVPRDPVLYLFVPREYRYADDEVSFAQRQLRDVWVSSPEGAPLPFVMERIADDAVAVYRISVRAATEPLKSKALRKPGPAHHPGGRFAPAGSGSRNALCPSSTKPASWAK